MALGTTVDAQVAVRIPDVRLDARLLQKIDGDIWIATTGGAYRIDGMDGKRVPNADLIVFEVHSAGDAMWLATSSGAYRVTTSSTTRIPDEQLDVISMSIVDRTVWLATNRGAYRIDGDEARQVGPTDLVVQQIIEARGRIWLATNRGAFIVDGDQLQRVVPTQAHDGMQLVVRRIYDLRDAVWLATASGAYQILADGTQREFGVGLDVISISEIGEEVWLATDKGAFVVEHQAVHKRSDGDDLMVQEVTEAGGRLWLATNRGAYEWDGGQWRKWPTEHSLPVKEVRRLNGRTWFATYNGAYIIDGTSLKRVPDIDIDVRDIQLVDGAVWLTTSGGAYRIVDAVVDVALENVDSTWKSVVTKLSPWPLWIEGDFRPRVEYRPAEGNLPPSIPGARQFDLIIESARASAIEAARDNRYTPADKLVKTLGPGRVTLYVNVRDRWGNTFEKSISGVIVPGPLVAVGLLVLLWSLLVAAVAIAAPYNKVCQLLFMKRSFRNIGSAGLIPLILMVSPSMRRYSLRRYLAGLNADRKVREVLTEYEVPSPDFELSVFGQTVEENRAIQLTGQSGIGKTSYFMFLTAVMTSRLIGRERRKARDLALRAAIPVFVPLGRYHGQKPEDMVSAQLALYGGLTAPDFAEWYLRQGGFIVFFDGLNEVDDITRSEINRYVDQGRSGNYFCVSSQDGYSAFGWMKQIVLPALEPRTIELLLSKKLGLEAANGVLRQFTEDTYSLYRVPQDLDFLADMLTENPTQAVPRSKAALYHERFASVFALWAQSDHADYADLLTSRAYKMLLNGTAILDDEESGLGDELLSPLIGAKIAVTRGGRIYFQHNLLRDYLASVYFRPRWRELMSEGAIALNMNWAEMLKFALADIPGEEGKSVIHAVLENNSRVAGELFNWMEATYPGQVCAWSNEFKIRYAEASLNRKRARSNERPTGSPILIMGNTGVINLRSVLNGVSQMIANRSAHNGDVADQLARVGEQLHDHLEPLRTSRPLAVERAKSAYQALVSEVMHEQGVPRHLSNTVAEFIASVEDLSDAFPDWSTIVGALATSGKVQLEQQEAALGIQG